MNGKGYKRANHIIHTFIHSAASPVSFCLSPTLPRVHNFVLKGRGGRGVKSDGLKKSILARCVFEANSEKLGPRWAILKEEKKQASWKQNRARETYKSSFCLPKLQRDLVQSGCSSWKKKGGGTFLYIWRKQKKTKPLWVK